jgi:hypothetical protein
MGPTSGLPSRPIQARLDHYRRDFFTRIPLNSGLHLVPVPFTKMFADYYTLGGLEAKDYPSLIAEGQKVDTIAGAYGSCRFNWPKDSDRYRGIERFVERLFAWIRKRRMKLIPRRSHWEFADGSLEMPRGLRSTRACTMTSSNASVPAGRWSITTCIGLTAAINPNHQPDPAPSQ